MIKKERNRKRVRGIQRKKEEKKKPEDWKEGEFYLKRCGGAVTARVVTEKVLCGFFWKKCPRKFICGVASIIRLFGNKSKFSNFAAK